MLFELTCMLSYKCTGSIDYACTEMEICDLAEYNQLHSRAYAFVNLLNISKRFILIAPCDILTVKFNYECMMICLLSPYLRHPISRQFYLNSFFLSILELCTWLALTTMHGALFVLT